MSVWNKVKSPISINQGQLNRMQASGQVTADLTKLVVLNTGLEYYNSQADLIMAEAFDKDKQASKEQDGYLRHPVYTFYGVHESILLGFLGLLRFTSPDPSQESGHITRKYQAFGMRFKSPAEHSIDGE